MNRNRNHRLVAALGAAALLAIGTAGADTFFIEIDYMGPDGGHDHMPAQIVLDAVVQMFACQGHTLVIDLDDEVPHHDFLTGDPDDDCRNFFTYSGAANTYASIRAAFRDHGAGWHYCIFAHQYRRRSDSGEGESPGCYGTTSSGLASGGDAFIVSLGAWDGQTGTLFEQAALLAHEFGHNLGLSHCGTCAGGNEYLLNMPSIMTYQYTVGGVRTGMLALGLTFEEALFKDLDYSHGRACALNESNLDEPRGTRMMSVDFNCDDDTDDTGVVQDLNFGGFGIGIFAPWCYPTDVDYAFLTDYDEWANLDDGATLLARGDDGDDDALLELSTRHANVEPCITREERDRITWDLQLRGGPSLVVEPCFAGLNVYIGNVFFDPVGTCSLPFGSVQDAQAASPAGSVYYIAPGTYDEAGATVLDKAGLYTCNTGTAVIR